MKLNDVIEGLKDPKDNPCWKGYKPVGTKKKAGKTVPNCVPKESLDDLDEALWPGTPEYEKKFPKDSKPGQRRSKQDYGYRGPSGSETEDKPSSEEGKEKGRGRRKIRSDEAVKQRLDAKCWKGYKKQGTKVKGGVRVNNCVPNESLKEYGDTAKGQKMLTKVQKRATDRMIKADDKRDAKDAKKNQDTANRAWDRMTDKDLEEARYGRSNNYYNPMDYERDQQRQMDYDRREFKRQELQHELGHEDDPDFERNFRQQQIDRDRGPWYIKINGKILRVKGDPKVFDWRRGANNYALAIQKNKPELQGKIMLTKKGEDDVAESKTTVKVPVTQKPRQGPLRPQTGAGKHQDKKKDQKQGKEKHKKAYMEAGTLKVAKDDDATTVLQNPTTGVQTQIDKKNPNAPKITQDETGKLKLQMPNSAQAGGDANQPKIVGKDVEIATPPMEDVSSILRLAGL